MRLSVVVPTLDEATALPELLAALARQSQTPDEMIVADAGSRDGTVEVALLYGARVVKGGLPAAGRNAGAAAATGELILFLDADVIPGRTLVSDLLVAFDESGFVAATCTLQPLQAGIVVRTGLRLANACLRLVQSVRPHAPGCCIVVRRDVHEAIGGFDESLLMGEDHDYFRRASLQGSVGVLSDISIAVSMRRLERCGLLKLAAIYAWSEVHTLLGRPVRRLPFEYPLGGRPVARRGWAPIGSSHNPG